MTRFAPFTTTAQHGVPHSPKAPMRAAVSRSTRMKCSIRWLLHLIHTVLSQWLRTTRQRRQLAQLSERQLRDAGIDPALAGRGQAIVVDRNVLLRLQALTNG